MLDAIFKRFKNSQILRINEVTQEVSFNGKELGLPHLSFKLLILLARKSPESVSFNEIEEEVWNAPVTRETLKQRVSLLRESLVSLGVPSDALLTLRSVGYKLTLATDIFSTEQQRANQAQQSPQWVKTGVAIAIIVSLLAFFIDRRTNNKHDTQPFTLDKIRIAVVESEADGQFTASRLLISQLSKLQSVEVLAVSANEAAEDLPLTSIARNSAADLLITTSVMEIKNQARLSFHLVEGRTGVILRAQDYAFKSGQEEKSIAHFINEVSREVQFTGLQLATIREQLQEPELQKRYYDAHELARVPTLENLNTAITLLDEILQQKPSFTEGKNLRARLLADTAIRFDKNADRIANTLQEVKEIVAANPTVARFIYTLARVEIASGQPEAALGHLRQVENYMPFVERDILSLEKQLMRR